ncbi:POTRA domain-containing protein [Pararhodonellum marinum]|uniref:POTRA domain-containing protein n=1 Tax=Pararhodonellum marinum TaxID=2755358 RepID=UPI001E597CC8|nr:POTRA domain-containing protein [Pararhodonellum marinum]
MCASIIRKIPCFFYLLLFWVGWVPISWSQIQDPEMLRDSLEKVETPEQITINSIFIVGNEKTQKNIIQREMDLSEGITYDWDEFVELLVADQKKIYNLQLFTSVEVLPIMVAEDQAEVLVTIKERWYILPAPIFSLADRNFTEWWVNQNRDFSRVNYGLRLDHANVGGRNEKLKVAGQLGFTQAFLLNYSKPYIDKQQLHGLAFSFLYFTNKTIPIRSVDNKQVFYTNENEEVLRRTLSTALRYTYRGSFYNFHYFSLGFHNTLINEDVLLQNPNFFIHDDNRLRYFFASYSYRHDKRDNVAYARQGQLLQLGLNRYGLFSTDDVNETEFTVLANKYTRLNRAFHFVTGLSSSFYLSPQQPYTLVKGIGYQPDFIRGYELNVIEGQQLFAHKNSLRFQFLNVAYDMSDFMPIDELSVFPFQAYLSLNFDHGFVRDRNNLPENAALTNSYLYGYGLGLDLVTFYDLVFRFEYSINSQGMGNFFINLRAPF